MGRKKLGVLREAIMLGMWGGEGRVVQAEVLAEDRDKELRIRKGKCSHCRKSFSSQAPFKSPKWRLPMSADTAFFWHPMKRKTRRLSTRRTCWEKEH